MTKKEKFLKILSNLRKLQEEYQEYLKQVGKNILSDKEVPEKLKKELERIEKEYEKLGKIGKAGGTIINYTNATFRDDRNEEIIIWNLWWITGWWPAIWVYREAYSNNWRETKVYRRNDEEILDFCEQCNWEYTDNTEVIEKDEEYIYF